MASSPRGVQAAVIAAGEGDLPVAVQATGRGLHSSYDGGLLINTSRMSSVRVDPDRRIARVGPGRHPGPGHRCRGPVRPRSAVRIGALGRRHRLHAGRRGRRALALRMMHAGDAAEAERLIEPLRAAAGPALVDGFRVAPYGGVAMGATAPRHLDAGHGRCPRHRHRGPARAGPGRGAD